MSNFSFESALSESERLALSALGSHEDDEGMEPLEGCTTIISTPRFPLPAAILHGGVPVAPRFHMSDDDEGEGSTDVGEDDEDDTPRRYSLKRIPSWSQVSAELRSMGYAWND